MNIKKPDRLIPSVDVESLSINKKKNKCSLARFRYLEMGSRGIGYQCGDVVKRSMLDRIWQNFNCY